MSVIRMGAGEGKGRQDGLCGHHEDRLLWRAQTTRRNEASVKALFVKSAVF